MSKEIKITIDDNNETTVSGKGKLTKKEIEHITWILNQMNPEEETTKEDCEECKRFNNNPEICFDFPELNIIEARKQCSTHDKEVCHGIGVFIPQT